MRSAESGLQCVLFANASAGSGLISSSPPENHYNLAFKAFRKTAFTERETFASLENEPCRWWWWRWRSVLLLKKPLRGFYSRLETNSRKAPPPDSSPEALVVPGSATTRSIAAPAPANAKLPPHTVLVPGLHVLFKGMDGQTRPVAGLTGDSTQGDLYKALRDLCNGSVVLGQNSCAFGLLYRGRPVRNDPGVLLCTVLTGGGDHLLVQCPHEPGGMQGLFAFQDFLSFL